MNVEGLDDLKAKFQELPQVLQRKVLRQAVDYAATPFLREAKSNVVQKTGTLARNLIKKAKTYPKTVMELVGPKNTYVSVDGINMNPGMYGHFVEGGAQPHIAHGKHPGAKAQPFLAPAYETTKGEVMDRFAQKLREGMDKL